MISDLRRPPLVLLGGGRGFRLRRLPPATSDRAPIGWGTVVGDFNNDGHADVLVAGGDLGLDGPTQRSLLYLGDGRGGFREVGRSAGLGARGRGRGVAVADVNADGRLDVLISRLGERAPLLLVNRGAPAPGKAHWLELRLRGAASPRDPCGAVVVVRHGASERATSTVSCGSDGLASGDHLIHVGLGASSRADLEVTWPSGRRQRLRGIRADRVLEVTEPR